MNILNDAQVSNLLDYEGTEDALVSAFGDLGRSQAQAMVRSRVDCGPVKLSAMGAIWLRHQIAAVKCYPTIEGRFAFALNLFDLHRNELVAVLPGTEITRFRTAAMARLAARAACQGVPEIACIFGFGTIGRSIGAALDGALPIQELHIVDPAVDAQLLASMQPAFKCRLKIASVDSVERSGLVITATRSKNPVFNGKRLAPGTTVIAMGTSLPNGSELDETTLGRAARVVVEWKPQSISEAGEVVLGLKCGALSPDRLVDLPELLTGRANWRESSSDIVVFKSVGIGLADLAAAWLACARHKAAARRETA
nr:ornithine cyclodeaminase family protein [uncultured Acidovorax sp.]